MYRAIAESTCLDITTQKRPTGARTAALIAGIAASLTFAAPALAQSKHQRAAAFKDWAVFVDDKAPEKSCWAATVPIETKASKDGIQRGEAFLSVATFPTRGVSNEVSVKLGYPADTDKEIVLVIDGNKFPMFNDGEEAWLESPEQDGAVINAMRRGAKAEVTAVSTRGTRVTDVYSLLGLTNSLERAAELCK